MRSTFQIFMVFLGLVLAWSCEKSDLSVEKDRLVNIDSKLEGTWLLVNGPLDLGLSERQNSERGPAWIHLQQGGKMRGHSSRNILAGHFTTKDNNKISLEVNMSTRVADNAFSTWFMDGLRSASDYRIEDNTLTFFGITSREDLIFGKLESQCRPVVKNSDLFNSPTQEADASIKAVYQIENCLVLDVTYSGGCVEQEPELVWNGNLSKSLPPLATLKLHFPKKDDCEALVQRTYYFDLIPFFKDAAYNEIRVNIPGWKNELRVIKQ